MRSGNRVLLGVVTVMVVHFAVPLWAAAADTEKRKMATKTQLMDADRAFARAAADRGLDGWMNFIAEDAGRMGKPGEKIVAGKDAIRKQDATIFANPKRKLTWEPLDAHVFADGAGGVTSGRYKVVGKQDDGTEKVLATGGYVTWWRKEADGKWKVIFDTGTADSPPKAP